MRRLPSCLVAVASVASIAWSGRAARASDAEIAGGDRSARRAAELATEEAQDALDIPPEAREDAAAIRAVEDELAGSGDTTRHGGRRRTRWSWLLPRLVLDASVADRGGARTGEWRSMALAQFTTGPADARPPALPPPRPVAARPPPVAAAPPPCLAELHRRAVGLATLEPDRARSYLERAARAGWLPEIRLRVERRLGRRQSAELPLDAVAATDPLDLSTANEVRYEARLIWDLGRIVFASEELAAQATAVRMADARRELLSAVDHLFFTRRRLATRADDAAGAARDGLDDADARADPAQRLAEVEAELDELTDGASKTCR
jgi:hypothetical protein